MKYHPAFLKTEQRLTAEVSGPRLMEYTREIARYDRASGSVEERKAFEYIQGLLTSFGLAVKLYEHDAYISLPGPARILLNGEPGPECYTTSFGVNTPPEGVTAELVYCGGGAPADLAGRDVRGKVVLLDGLPAAPKTLAVEAAGAIGQINIAGEHLHWMIISPVWGSPTPERLAKLPTRPCTTIRSADGQALKERLQQGPIQVTLHTQVDTGWRKTPLLVGEIAGQDPEFVLFSGHVDSWLYGAMDNGTANATMIECARLLAPLRGQLKRGVRFAFWSGHSHGRYSGSAWYADHHWEELNRHCVCHLNVDSVGAIGADSLTEAVVMAETRDLARDVIGAQTGVEFEGRRIGRMGDQSFVGLGVPSLFMSLSEQVPSEDATSKAMQLRLGRKSGGLGWWWHTKEDLMDKIDAENLIRDARVYMAVLWRLVAAPVLPINAAEGTADLANQLEDLQRAGAGRLDLTVALKRAFQLTALTREVQTLAEATAAGLAEADTPELRHRAALINRILMAVERRLIPIGYAAGSQFDHDPALPTPAVPGLDPVRRLVGLEPDSTDARFLMTQLVRARNRVDYALSEAIASAEAGLQDLKGE